MNTPATWRTDDTCPCCGTVLRVTDTPAAVTFECGACGWTLTADLVAAGVTR